MLTVKTCTKCGETKPLAEFQKAKDTADGYRGRCKRCVADYMASYYQKNRDRMDANSKNWRSANPDGKREIQRRYFESKREEILRKNSSWNKSNRERVREAGKRYSVAHPDRVRSKNKARVLALTDSYVRGLIRSANGSDSALVEAKRWQVKIQRLIHQLNGEK